MEMIQRFRGALIGLSTCDALGQHEEFRARDSYPLLTEFKSGGTWGLKAGSYTDDTSMALCLADSLIECNGFDAKDCLTRFSRWWKEGYLSVTGHCFDIGSGTRQALSEFMRKGTLNAQSGAGNGSLMRLCPVVMAYFENGAAHASRVARESSITTHGDVIASDCVSLFSKMLFDAFSGKSKEEICSDISETGWFVSQVDEIAFGSYKKKTRNEIKSSGYCVDTLEAALWAFWTTDTFEAGAIAAVNLGEDTDSIGAVYGQLAGAFYGYDAIPVRWRDNLVKKELVLDFADRLFALSGTL